MKMRTLPAISAIVLMALAGCTNTPRTDPSTPPHVSGAISMDTASASEVDNTHLPLSTNIPFTAGGIEMILFSTGSDPALARIGVSGQGLDDEVVVRDGEPAESSSYTFVLIEVIDSDAVVVQVRGPDGEPLTY